MSVRDFSTRLLQLNPTQLVVMEMRDGTWKAWAPSCTVENSLQRIGKCPAWADNVVTLTDAR